MLLVFNYVIDLLFFKNVKLFAIVGFCHLILQLTLRLIKQVAFISVHLNELCYKPIFLNDSG